MDADPLGPNPTSVASASPSDCPLSWPEQRRNLLLFAGCTGMQYLAAPVLYVGVTQASLLGDRLGASDKVANLPATAFFSMTAVPALIAWLVPYVSCLKRNLVACYAVSCAMLAIVAITLVSGVPDAVKIGAVIVQGAVSGAVMPAAIAFLWEVIGRGSAESRRGLALSLAFGAGPILAVLGSLGSQLLLSGELGALKLVGLKYPWNFTALFGAAAPVMALAALLSSRFVVPLPAVELPRQPFSTVLDLCAGICFGLWALRLFFLDFAVDGYVAMALAVFFLIHHFWDILTNRLLLVATIVTVLVYTGNTIPSNMNLYTPEVLGDLAENYAGFQNSLRFGFKVVAGFLLGWLLMKTNPKTGILVTAAIFVASQFWAIAATGVWYLVAFGVYGAGELVGVYAPNYILSASHRSRIRRNMAFGTMLMAPAAPAAYMFGGISDHYKKLYESPAVGFRVSFAVCAAIMLAGIVIAVLTLPARPRPEDGQQPLG